VATDDLLPTPASGVRNRYQVLAVCGLLLLAVGLVFGQTVRYGFVNYDDNAAVYENPQVTQGLTPQGVVWAFTHRHIESWAPLSCVSHMFDCQVFGLNAGGHHLTNVLLHVATVALLFLVLCWMTGQVWPSAFVAALLAVHPLHVESVAWVTERKDVLSGLFAMLTLAAYVGYVRHPFSLARYLAVMGFFALGLVAKPILVTLPMVMLLLDYWPLRRMSARQCLDPMPPQCDGGALAGGADFLNARLGRFSFLARPVVEKVPLLLVVALSCRWTFWGQGQVLALVGHTPLWCRLGNALVSYMVYLGQFFYPVGLAVLYPPPGLDLPLGKIVAAFLLLVAITAATLVWRRRFPYLLVGWLWYLGMMVPVIGLVQFGTQGMADRHTYFTQIGLSIALTWGVTDLCRSWSYRRWVCGAMSALVLLVLMACAWRQTSFWCDTETLWAHTLACTSRNSGAHNNLGAHLAAQGHLDEAMAHYRQALQIEPDYPEAHNNLGVALSNRGHFDEATAHFRQALKIQPNYAEAHGNLGLRLAARGQLDEALAHYQTAVEIDPDGAEFHSRFGGALAARGQFDAAIVQFRQALEIQPENAIAHSNLGAALANLGQLDEAIVQFQQALKIKPNDLGFHSNVAHALAAQGRLAEAAPHYRMVLKIQPNNVEAQTNLAWLRATCPIDTLRNGAEAIELAQRANTLCAGKRPDVLDCLAAAYAEAGWFPEALASGRQALELARQQGAYSLADAVRGRIALYEAGKPYRQPLPSSAPPPPKR